ncbi:hypothetical protein PRIPAC_92064 [Pristionchus pacificus]|uniref:PDZ domain-containing protein n=1 Tax=Pristionchus pacificus TaxID=54126 RepID=A0A2A6BBJ7_PRIPA|nr:hypothetical protein PRIPAC_92064 [Pristionchus pacificus]|eukprot:PDM63253.1 PDZ domain-containing protein [Pristionchus pacificus]
MVNVHPAENLSGFDKACIFEIEGNLNGAGKEKKKTTNLKKLKSRFRSLLFSIIKHGKNIYEIYPDPYITLTVNDGCETENDSMSTFVDNAQTDRIVTIRTGSDGRFGISRYGTSICRVRKGSSANLEGIKKGDQIVSINEINVETLYFDIVPDQFKQARETGRIRLVLRHNPDRLNQLKWLRRVRIAIRNRLSKCD